MANIFESEWDENKPDGDREIPLGDDDIRELKRQVRERLEIDHHVLQSEGTDPNVGFHDKVTLLQRNTDYNAQATALILYGKLSGSYTELFARHENVGVVQWSILGKLNAAALGIASEADGDILRRVSGVWGRLGIGTALQQLRVNAGATDIEYFTPDVATALVQSEVQATNDVTISSTGTYALVDDMTLTFTSTGKRTVIYHSAGYRGSTDTENIFQIQVDDVGKAEGSAYYYGRQHVFFKTVITLTAGSHTVTVKHKTGSPAGSTFYQDGSVTRRILGVYELPDGEI